MMIAVDSLGKKCHRISLHKLQPDPDLSIEGTRTLAERAQSTASEVNTIVTQHALQTGLEKGGKTHRTQQTTTDTDVSGGHWKVMNKKDTHTHPSS